MKNWCCLILFTLLTFIIQAQNDSTSTNKKKLPVLNGEKGYYLNSKSQKDTSIQLIDSSIYNTQKEKHFYDSLQQRMEKSRTGRLINQYLIRDHQIEETLGSDFVASEDYFIRFEGKIIKTISFVEIDVAEGSVQDSSKHIKTWLGRLLENTHTYTHERVLRKSLLIEVGDRVKPFKISDNERIIRSLPYIADAKIYIVPTEEDTNQVNVAVFVQDRYSLGTDGGPSAIDKYSGEIYELNFLGTGNELSYKMDYDGSSPIEFGYNPRIRLNNVFGSFINGGLEYQSKYQLEEYSANFSKDFIAPQIKYIGGYSYLESRSVYSHNYFNVPDSLEPELSYHARTNDAWVGRAYLLDNSQERNNIVFSTRFKNQTFLERPFISLDSNRYFHNYSMALGSVALVRSTYFKTKKLHQFGVSEDIPRGYLASITGGIDFHEYETRPYLGIKLWGAHYFHNLGYYSIIARMGSFFSNGSYQDWVTTLRLEYFTRLIHLGKYDFRQFINFYYSNVKNLNYSQDRVQFSNYIRGIEDFFDEPSEMAIINFEPVFFAPWNWVGFRFAFYGFYDVGVIKSKVQLNTYRRAYSAAGFGFRIRNDNLAFSIIQIRLAYYFNTPDGIDVLNAEFSTNTPNYYKNETILKPDLVRFGQ